MIWVKREEEYFCNQDWTGQIRLNCFNKSAVSRKIGAKRRPMTGSVRVRIHSGYGFRASAPRAARMTGADAGSFVIVRDDGNPAPACSTPKAKLPPSFSDVLPRGLWWTPMRQDHGTTWMSVSKSDGSSIKTRIRLTARARIGRKSSSAACAALKSASTIRLLALVSSGKKGPRKRDPAAGFSVTRDFIVR